MEAGTAVAAGKAKLVHGSVTIEADQICYDSKTHEVNAEGNVTLTEPGGRSAAAGLRYNLATGQKTAIETASPVPEKPGFVTSPYAPSTGYIDVRGFPPGTDVKDPYTGRVFRVP